MAICIKRHLRLYALLVSLMYSSALMAKIFVHHLHYQKAEHLLPAIQAQLDKNAKLSANEYQLIINSSLSDNIKVLNILKELDQPRKSYQVEIQLLDKPINQLAKTQGIVKPRAKPVERQESQNKNYRIAANKQANIYFYATALDNVPLTVKQLFSYPISPVVFYHGLYLPTAKRVNLHKGFEVRIHQSKSNQLLVQISAAVQTAKLMQPEAQVKLLASTELIIQKNQWVLFAATSEQSFTTAVKPPTKENTQNNAVKANDKMPANNDVVKNKTYTTGKGSIPSKWFYLKVTDLINN